MLQNPKISIIVPAYNADKTIKKCVDSLIAQTYENIEIILVNDCSSDNTGNICKEYTIKDSRIRTVSTTINSGPSQSRNLGMNIATGFWLTFVDSDDWIEPETYKTAIAYANKYDAECVMWSYSSEYNSVSKRKHIYNGDVVFGKEFTDTIFIDTLGPTGNRLRTPELLHSTSVIWNKLFKNEIIKNHKIMFYNLEEIGIEDLFFSAQYLSNIPKKKSVYIDKCFYHYVKTDGSSISNKHKQTYTQGVINVNNRLESIVSLRDDKEICLKALNNRRALSLINIGLNEIAAKDDFFKILLRLKTVLQNKQFQDAFKQLEYKYLPFKWKIFFRCAQFKMAFCIYLLLKLMSWLMTIKD